MKIHLNPGRGSKVQIFTVGFSCFLDISSNLSLAVWPQRRCSHLIVPNCRNIFLFRLLDFFYVGFVFFFISQCLRAMEHISFRVKNYVFILGWSSNPIATGWCFPLHWLTAVFAVGLFPSYIKMKIAVGLCKWRYHPIPLYQSEKKYNSIQITVEEKKFS